MIRAGPGVPRVLLPLTVAFLVAVSPARAEHALTVYTGRFTGNDWEDFFWRPGDIRYADSYILAVAPSTVLKDLTPSLRLEAEGQAVRHFGEQQHWEFNGALVGRWHAFPWDRTVRSSAAFGVGPSWASERPALEPGINGGETRQLLVYWFLEVTAAPADWERWAGSLRLHHRSGAFGLVAAKGGSNVLSLGLRRRF
jgi:hypothetical protein